MNLFPICVRLRGERILVPLTAESIMSRKVIISLAAIATVGFSALVTSTTEADARRVGISRGGNASLSMNRSVSRLSMLRRPLSSSIATRRISGGASCPPGQFCRPDAGPPNYPKAKGVPPFTPPPAATIPSRRPSIPPMAKLGTRPSGTLASTNVSGPHRCQQTCRPVVVGRRCAAARGEYNPKTNSGTASHCVRWEPITQNLCERQCTSGGVYYWR